MIDNTFDKLNKISKLHFYDNRFNNDIKTVFHNKNESNLNKRYQNKPYNNRENQSWRKQKADLSENGSNNSCQHQLAPKHINQYKSSEKHSDLNIEPSTSQHKVIDKKFTLPIQKSIKPINSLNNSDNIKTKLKKFENKFSSSSNLHVVTLESNSINKPFSSGTDGRGSNRYGDNKPSWRNKSLQHFAAPQIQDIEVGYKNKYPKNQQDGNPKHKFGNSHLSSRSCKKDIDDTES